MAATINDVARRAGVAKKTVSRVINNEPHVSPVLRSKVEAAIAELGFVPHSAARQLASNRAFTIGLATGPVPPDLLAMVLSGATYVARENGYALVVAQFDSDDPTSIVSVCNFARRRQIDGLILGSGPQAVVMEFAALLPLTGVPWVHIGPHAMPPDVPAVRADDHAGAYAITEHLLELGHRRIAYARRASDAHSERQAGFEAALEAWGIQRDPRYIAASEHSGFEGGVSVGRVLLAVSPRPTAICALNDEIAAGVIAAAQEMGVRVPAELSVTGFDDFSIAQQTRPALTTVRVPVDAMSRAAVEILIGMIHGQPPPDQPVRFAPTLVIRESTGSCPTE